jgi:hypothetical protein
MEVSQEMSPKAYFLSESFTQNLITSFFSSAAHLCVYTYNNNNLKNTFVYNKTDPFVQSATQPNQYLIAPHGLGCDIINQFDKMAVFYK